MNEVIKARGRLLRQAKALKAYFDRKIKSDPGDIAATEEARRALESLLESAQQLEVDRDQMILLEQHLEMNREETPSNVIPLRRPPRGPTFGTGATGKRWTLKLDCLIESPHVSEIHKMALELHSHSQRYAFLEFRDLDKNARKDLGELTSLGAISLFVPSILDLTSFEQEMLRQLILQDTLQRPLLMVGSTLPYAELRCEPGLNLDFLAVLSRAYIKLSRPFSEYKEKNLIHYFLDSLS
jgi:hypothetical protein